LKRMLSVIGRYGRFTKKTRKTFRRLMAMISTDDNEIESS
uniref:PIPO n=1 Tax=Heligmosomoides polygyrus TaxID=6339 RepID=A0A183FZ00_HELPZ